MSLLDTKQAPKREDRLHPCISYGGTVCGLRKKLGGGCMMQDGEREFAQGSLCLLLPALAIINSMPNNVTLMHAAVGCGSCLHSQNGSHRGAYTARFGKTEDAMWVSTALSETDVINGGETKLRSAILEVDRLYRPKTITVVTGCVPGIIGDDVDGLIDDLKENVTATIVPVHCEGFKTKIWATAYDAVYHGIGRTLIDDPEEWDRKKEVLPDDAGDFQFEYMKKRTVNLFNISSMSKIDEDELTRLLNSLDLDVNIFPLYTDTEQMWRVKYAALSISTCPTHDDYFLKFLEEKYHIPYLLQHMPIGIANTGDWIRLAAKHFGKEEAAERLIARETADLDRALVPYREFFAGKTAFVSAGEYRALATSQLLHELGFKIIGVRAFHHDEFAEHEYEKLEQIAGDIPFNVANMQPFEEANMLKRLNPDLFLGHSQSNATAAKMGIPTHTVFSSSLPYIGYRGAFELARRVYKQLINPVFGKTYFKLPYKESWYKENPFKYIREAVE
ncbi:oxidoreductase nitrogenase component 1 [Spirochaetia bacterium]|nr:oxidoreductase nitrogenase component 1 [Spirochaetia bacterium]